MSTKLAEVWSEVGKLLEDGISLIPVRDKDELTKFGDVYLAKTPYKLWKEFQSRRVSKDELWQQMDEKNTTAIALVCGEISGNIEVIDVDVKYKPGIDTTLFQDIRAFYPELFSRLRIHKTPSSGSHIIYRVDGQKVPGNLKLAGRPASEDEIELQISRGAKRPNKEVNFLETRGEGGYILCPPSLGYIVQKDNPIPVISWEERCALITLCESYTELIKEVPKPKPAKSQESFYSENPFEHFNNETDPVELIERFGWKFSHKNQKFIWFTRPDKTKGVSASWNTEKHIYYVFTSSTELQANRGYHPSTLLSELQFGGDKSKTYHYLVGKGYGRVKKDVETKIVKRAAASGKQLPANFSAEAKADYIFTVERLKEDHPYGIFIKYDGEAEKMTVSYESLLSVAKELGLYSFDGQIVYVKGHIVERITDRKFQDILKGYIREEDADEYEKLCNVFEKFLKDNTKFITTRLPILDGDLISKDTRDECFKYYGNGYLHITKDTIEFNTFEHFDKLVWFESIQPRAYKKGEGGRFVEYLNLALVNPEAVRPVLGFLSHEFKDETTGFIIVLTEACIDPKMGGGSGKNVFCNLLNLTTTYSSSPGSQGKFDEKFFQSWNYERVFGINDLPKNFDFANLKEAASGTIKLKKLWSNEQNISVENAPKLITQTNFSYVNTDGGLKRRIIPVEFTDFFTKCGGLDMHFGVHFPKGWADEDYAGFDNYISECIQIWMRKGCKLSPTELTESGWVKQWEQTFKLASTFVQEHIETWIKSQVVSNRHFDGLLDSFANENNLTKHFIPSKNSINKAIEEYCKRYGYEYKKDVPKRFDGSTKCRIFYKCGAEEPSITEEKQEEETPF